MRSRWVSRWAACVVIAAAMAIAVFCTACGSNGQGPPGQLLLTFADASAEGRGVTVEVVTASGGQPHRLAFLPRAVRANVSPDGSKVVVEMRDPKSHRGALYIQRLGGTARTRITPYGEDAAWSPDGTQLAYQGVAGHIFVYDTRTRRSLPLTPSQLTDEQPAWSPDGTQIAFARYQPYTSPMDQNTGAVAVVDLRQQRVTRISPYDFLVQQLAWEPGGERIGISTLDTGLVYAFGVRHSTAGTIVAAGRAFAWSHDGATVAIGQSTLVDGDHSFLAFGGRRVGRIRSDELNGGISEPAWSPDNRFVAFVGCRAAVDSTGSPIGSDHCAVYLANPATLTLRTVALLPDGLCNIDYLVCPFSSAVWRS